VEVWCSFRRVEAAASLVPPRIGREGQYHSLKRQNGHIGSGNDAEQVLRPFSRQCKERITRIRCSVLSQSLGSRALLHWQTNIGFTEHLCSNDKSEG